MNNETTNRIKKMINMILATSTAKTATPENPKIPAMRDTTKKVMTHPSIEKLAKVAPVINNTSERTKKIRKTKKIILAISANAIAIPEKPSNAAISAKTRNVSTQDNINDSFRGGGFQKIYYIKTETQNHFENVIIE
jgi:hypothetical protein